MVTNLPKCNFYFIYSDSFNAHCLHLKNSFIATKEGAGAVDEEDFIKAFDDVPVVQVSEDI